MRNAALALALSRTFEMAGRLGTDLCAADPISPVNAYIRGTSTAATEVVGCATDKCRDQQRHQDKDGPQGLRIVEHPSEGSLSVRKHCDTSLYSSIILVPPMYQIASYMSQQMTAM
jgi:hypothetical protein